MFTTVAYETSASESALTNIVPVPDVTVALGTSNDIRVPVGLANVPYLAAMINSSAATLKAQLSTPKLRGTLLYDISPINNGLVFGSLPRLVRMPNTPLVLAELESMNFLVQNGANVMNRGLVWLSDGPMKPTTSGQIFTVRATGAASLVTATWVNTALTLGQTLPIGTYQIVGLRCWGANAVAARIVIPGYAWRPGAPCLNAEDNNEWGDFRLGGTGVWAQFQHTVPPSLDVLGVTDTAQVVLLDLIKSA